MARLRITESAETDNNTLYRDSSRTPASAQRDGQASSSSPSPSTSSNKENHHSTVSSKSSMAPPAAPFGHPSTNSAKRRRLTERDEAGTQRVPVVRTDERSVQSTPNPHTKIYDPHQNPDEVRHILKGYRALQKEAQDSRAEWMQPGSKGLLEAIERSDNLFQSVKQTSTAVVDSSFLVQAGDLVFKKSKQSNLGGNAQGIDVDEFVGRCLTFMRGGTDASNSSPQIQGRSSTQRRREHAGDLESDEDDVDGDETGDAKNWAYLGSQACFPANRRPPVSGFLLGPLSLQKRVRPQRARREKLGRTQPVETVRPQEIDAADIGRAENNTVTAMCKSVHALLGKVMRTSMDKANREAAAESETGRNLSEDDVADILDRNNLSDNEGISFFKFAINPHSFGQTVENLFHLSFLLRDDMLGIDVDSMGMPTLHHKEIATSHAQAQKSGRKHQSIFGMDFETWQDLIEAFDIKDSIIPHREVDHATHQIGRNGWYS